MSRTKASFLAGSIVAILLSAFAAFGQTPSGVTGVVTDQSGAVVTGATVTLLDTKTTKEQTAVTGDDGSYRFLNIEPGTGYRLTFTRTGFQTYILNEVSISVGRTETQNAQLTAGVVTARVEVVSTSGDVTLNTTDGTVGNVINQRQLRELPIQIRGSPAALLGLEPGVIGSNLGTASTNRVGSVTGSRADQGNITVDGIDANDQATGQAFNTVANAPIDSIQEFRGTVAGFNASDGRSSGGQVQLTTNSGTNNYHGNLREYYRTEKTAANAWFNNSSRTARPALRRHQYGGSIGGPLPFFNFGENNGPLFKSGKDKLFFFFDNERRRDRSQTTATRSVPLATFRAGQIGYVNNTAGCTSASRANTQPSCISYLTTAQLAALDPKHVGVDSSLLALYNSRFPTANDLTLGDGINTGGFRWNAPNTRDDHIYTFRVDAVPTDHQRLFFRTTLTRRASTNAIQFLPQDADAVSLKDNSYSWVIGHTWIISPSLTNVATVGMSKSILLFAPPADQPSFPFSFSGGTIGAPFASLSYQDRHVSTPTYRDDLTWVRGGHTIFAGFSYKPIRQESALINDFNFVGIGLGGLTSALATSLRPADLNANSTVISRYDTAFASMLGRIASVTTNYNYTPAGVPLAPGTGKLRNYAYNETEFYAQDNWKVKSNLTLNLGVRYALYPAPYETNGLLAIDTTDWRSLVATRVSNAAAGISGNSAEPFLTYQLAGNINNGPSLYKTDKNNWAPRVGFAYNPAFDKGILGKVLGDRKTVIRGSAGVTYDRVSGAVLFIQNQVDYIFQNSAITNFGNGTDPVAALLNDPRFIGVGSVPAPVITTPPTITKPFTPFVTAGVPTGESAGAFNFTIDHNFKTPYSYLIDFGIQRELPGNHLIDVSYVGRIGRSLFVQSDAGQVMNFKDPGSGQLLFNAFNALIGPINTCKALAANLQAACLNAVAPIPWFENQVGAASLSRRGQTCAQVVAGAGITTCTALVARLTSPSTFITRGDASDAVQSLDQSGLLFNNVGLSGQFASNAYITNQGTSDYHGILVSFRKRFSKGYQYEVNYTFSKSLDNNSTVANTVTGGLVCDVLNPNICRGPSDFDVRHVINADFIVDVPIGRGRWLGNGMNKWVDTVIGGWGLSGIVQGRSGLPFSPAPAASAFPIGFELGSPAVITNPSAFAAQIHDVNGTVQYYADPVAANAALRDPINGEFGQRNQLRGPSFWDLDMGLAKKINAPWSKEGTQRFTLRVDAFNVTNSNFFNAPGVTRSSSAFGQITSSASAPRELQFSLRFDF
jgi:hypothetical protein